VRVGKLIRLGRIMRRGRALIIAIDHGLKAGPLRGIEDPRAVVRAAREAGADAIMATPPVIEHVHSELGDLRVVARVDGGSTTLGPDVTRDLPVFSVEEAVAVGADAVVAFGYVGVPGEAEQLSKLSRIARDCRRLGMPLIAEMIPGEAVAHHFGRGERRLSAESIALAARVGWELGADAIKTYYTGSPSTFRRVVEACPIPILVLGGPRAPDFISFLKQLEEALEAGARGAVVGRNAWQHPRPQAAIRALAALVHEDRSAEEAAELAGLTA